MADGGVVAKYARLKLMVEYAFLRIEFVHLILLYTRAYKNVGTYSAECNYTRRVLGLNRFIIIILLLLYTM